MRSLATNVISDNGGWFALLALPFAAWGALVATMQLVDGVRARRADSTTRMPLLVNRLRRKRVEMDLRTTIVLDEPLPIRAHGSGFDVLAHPVAELYARLRRAVPLHIIGEAGAGKSTVALQLVAHALDQREQDADAPIVDIVLLRNWRVRSWRRALRMRRQSEWQELLDWIADELHGSHPTFGRRQLRRLLVEQHLLVCLDGLDEVAEPARAELMQAITAMGQAGMPVLVLSRESGSSGHARESRGSITLEQFETMRLQPIDGEVLERELARRAGWDQLLSDAEHPRVLRRALANPLLLSIALLTWPAGEVPVLLRTAADPAEAIWTTYLDRALADDGRRRPTLRDTAHWIAIVAAERRATDFRPIDLYWHHAARRVVLALWLAVFVVVVKQNHSSWVKGMLIAYLTAYLWGIHLGLRNADEGWLNRVRLRFGWATRNPLAFFWVVFAIVAWVGAIVATVVLSFATTTVGSAYEPLIEHVRDPGIIHAWWSQLAVPDVKHALLPWTAVAVAMPAGCAAGLHLTATDQDLLRSILPRRWKNVWSVRLVGLPLVAFGIAENELVTLTFGTMFATPALFMLISAAAQRLAGQAPRDGFGGACEALARLSILHRIGDRYRFRHQELARLLGMVGLQRLAREDSMRRLPSPRVAAQLTDYRMQPASVAATASVCLRLTTAFPRDAFAASLRGQFLMVAERRPAAAAQALRRGLASFPRATLRAQLAEAVDILGDRQEADAHWARVRASHPTSSWVMAWWTEDRLRRHDPRAAIDGLQAALREPGPNDAAWMELVYHRFLCWFGSADERALARGELERTAGTTSEQQATAALELARVELEVDRNPRAAHDRLRAIVEAGYEDPLLQARLAWTAHLLGDRDAMLTASHEAFARWTWHTLWLDQLELLTLTALLPTEPAAAARAQVDLLLRLGWRLWGYDPDAYVGGAVDQALVRQVFVPANAG